MTSRLEMAAVCRVADGRDVPAMIVEAGLERDCPHYSGGRYADDEDRAAWRDAAIRGMYRLPGYCK